MAGSAAKASIGFIGLGIMGRPMAANLVRAGHPLVVHSRSPEPVRALEALGARSAPDPATVAASVDVVVTMLPDSPDVEAVLLGEKGVIAAAGEGTLVIDMSTVQPQTAVAVADAARAAGLRPLDAPVSGGEQGAIDGALSIMVGGSRDDFVAATPIFEALGKTIVHVGPSGSGQTVKAANQLLVAGIIELVAEAIVFLEHSGVDLTPALAVLSGGLAGSQVLERKGAGMVARQFEPGFRVDLHHKDLGIVLAQARQHGVALPLTAVVSQLMTALRATGRGQLDHTALLALLDDLTTDPATRKDAR